MYELTTDRTENNRRVKTFRHTKTGSETKITPVYTDAAGAQWWGFVDLFAIPYMRMAMGKHILSTFSAGMSKADIKSWCAEEKALLKSSDPEKYEKLYALVLDKERLVDYVADPVKQHLAMCTVYILGEEERLDYFTDQEAEAKMKLWSLDIDAVTFFLNWHNKHIARYLKALDKISTTVSALQSASNKP